MTGYKVYAVNLVRDGVSPDNPRECGDVPDTGLTNGTTYFYKVSAVNAAGEGGLSGEASAVPAAAPGARAASSPPEARARSA